MATMAEPQSQFQLLAQSVFDESTDTQQYDEAYYNSNDWIPVTATADDFISVNTSRDNASISSRRKRVKKAIEDIKRMDSGYHAVVDKSGERIFEFYESNPIPGAKIRDAITGIRCDEDRVGSPRESLYFKVSYCGNNGNGEMLFFNSPEDYERHFKDTISTEIKAEWLDKKMFIMRQLGI